MTEREPTRFHWLLFALGYAAFIIGFFILMVKMMG